MIKTLAKPCPNDPTACACHICKLFRTDIRYRRLWGGDDQVAQPLPMSPDARRRLIDTRKARRALPCVFLGPAQETSASCGCGGSVKHACSVLGACRQYGSDPTLPNCATCDQYTPAPVDTVDYWVDILRGDQPTSMGRDYRPAQTAAVGRLINELRANLPPLPRFIAQRGVVTTGGGKYWPGSWAQAAMLREVGWREPIQAWYLGEAEHDADWIARLSDLGVQCVDALAWRRSKPARILNGFEVKLYAVLESGFAEPLWLDSDCYPIRHPGLLWDCPEYKRTGSIHWPDLANAEPWTKWERWGVEADDSPPIETGQFLYNLPAVWEEAQITQRLNEYSDLTYHWDYGDKGPARVAWAWTRRDRAIYRRVPDWVGPAFIHVAHDGLPVFIHRCRGKADATGENTFYTPQHKNGQEPCAALPGEAVYQAILAKVRTF